MLVTSFKTGIKTNLKQLLFVAVAFIGANAFSQSIFTDLESFNKIIISPHIQVTFVEGEKELVTIDSNKISDEKLNVEVNNGILRMYLDGAKTVTKSEKLETGSWQGKRSIYKGTIVTATITYKFIEELSLRGEETFVFQSPMQQNKLRLKVYGESQVYFNDLSLNQLNTTIYGSSSLSVNTGSINRQKTTCYGECKIDMPDVKNLDSKVTAYGEGTFDLNVSDNLKVTAYGEAIVKYKGNPYVKKGIVLGEASIIRK